MYLKKYALFFASIATVIRGSKVIFYINSATGKYFKVWTSKNRSVFSVC